MTVPRNQNSLHFIYRSLKAHRISVPKDGSSREVSVLAEDSSVSMDLNICFVSLIKYFTRLRRSKLLLIPLSFDLITLVR